MPDVQQLVGRPGFSDLPAVASGRVYLIDHSYFSRPGPRLADGVELLYQLLWEVSPSVAGCSGGAVLRIQYDGPDGASTWVPL